jgi:hypothetical protein
LRAIQNGGPHVRFGSRAAIQQGRELALGHAEAGWDDEMTPIAATAALMILGFVRVSSGAWTMSSQAAELFQRQVFLLCQSSARHASATST